MSARFRGLVAAVHTPLRADGELNLGRAEEIVERHVREGLAGIMTCGTTGEGALLTTPERRAVSEAYAKAARGKLPVIVHVGHASVREARGLAEHASEIGARAVAAAPPYHVRPAAIEDLVAALAEIAAGAPGLPFYYYHIPSMTGVTFPMTELLDRVGDRVPNFAGIKYTAPDAEEFRSCAEREGGRWDLLWGVDESLLSGLSAGARGAIGSTYNFAAPLYRRLWEAFERGDLAEARACQERSARLVEVVFRHGNQPAIKAIMRLAGLDCGPSRLPYAALSPRQLEALERDLAAVGFFEWSRAGSPSRAAP